MSAGQQVDRLEVLGLLVFMQARYSDDAAISRSGAA